MQQLHSAAGHMTVFRQRDAAAGAQPAKHQQQPDCRPVVAPVNRSIQVGAAPLPPPVPLRLGMQVSNGRRRASDLGGGAALHVEFVLVWYTFSCLDSRVICTAYCSASATMTFSVCLKCAHP
jgi:hypothetical protein